MSYVTRFDLTKVVFSKHALDRFHERFLNDNKILKEAADELNLKLKDLLVWLMYDPYLLEDTVRVLLIKAKEVTLPKKERLIRLLNNHCEEAMYFEFKDMRFVLKEKGENDAHVAVTIERITR